MNPDETVSVDVGHVFDGLVAMVDTRGFSAFAHVENNPQAVAGYVAAATRFILTRVRDIRQLGEIVIKPLGDGLLFILKFDNVPHRTMASSAWLMLHELVNVSNTFKSYLELNRPAGLSAPPSRLGIGVAFGPMVRLNIKSSDTTLELDDYVGHTINLASRLQELARNGGCVIHHDVFDKILQHETDIALSFHSAFEQKVEVRLRSIGTPEDTVVYTNADIPREYLKSKVDESRLEEFAKKAIEALRATYAKKRSTGSGRLLLPEATRFMLFRREGSKFREIVEYMVGQRMTFKTEVTIGVEEKGVSPVADAVLTCEPVLVPYSRRYDECDEKDPKNEYWVQTASRFPKAPIEALRKLNLHPASILAIPLDSHAGTVSAVAVLDSAETDVFNQAICDEVGISLPVLYGQMFGAQETETANEVHL